MSVDHLSTQPPSVFAVAVLAVLAGADLDTAAASHGLDAADLNDAVCTYQAAGQAALHQRADEAWYQVRVQFRDWSAAEHLGATRLGPALDRLDAEDAIAGWWFLRKHPCWRLRLLGADITAVQNALDELVASGVIVRWWPTVYEPEAAAFGGTAGIGTIHDLFCADTHGVLAYLRRDSPGLGRRELSVLLLDALMRAAGLDGFERGDVFDRVARLRPAPTEVDTVRVDRLADQARTLLGTPTSLDSPLFVPGGLAAHAAPWLGAYRTAGHELGSAATDGHLERGLRAILTHVMIFHWNRLGLSAISQGILARAASEALLPPR